MLSDERARVDSDRHWLNNGSDHLTRAEAVLDKAFAKLAGTSAGS